MQPFVIEESDINYDADGDGEGDDEEKSPFCDSDALVDRRSIDHDGRRRRKRRRVRWTKVRSPIHPELRSLTLKLTKHCYSRDFNASSVASQVENETALVNFLKETKCFYDKEAIAGDDVDQRRDMFQILAGDGDSEKEKNLVYCLRPRRIDEAMALSETPKILLTASSPFSVVHANGSALRSLAPWNQQKLDGSRTLSNAIDVLMAADIATGQATSVRVYPVLPEGGDDVGYSAENSSQHILYVLVEFQTDKWCPPHEATKMVG